MDIMGRYIRLANQYDMLFAIKNSHIITLIRIVRGDLITAHALNRDEVDFLARYPKFKVAQAQKYGPKLTDFDSYFDVGKCCVVLMLVATA
ncbi:hypothetical protein S101258_00173 [Lactiplantibacillus plantarum subsp. plantarum]|uniref:Uncharacterized protein n=1 Tax=Lactiplantibacillus plantarum subsp. plantarum TaxID=337330 RepID=A0A2S3U9Y3_LACPN|nr:hypothetical protein S101258_00173 [Lactiplantibacillus plantarum subsp. plantarum]